MGLLLQSGAQHTLDSILPSAARKPLYSIRRPLATFHDHHQNAALPSRRSRLATPLKSQVLFARACRHGSSWTSHRPSTPPPACDALPRSKTCLLQYRAIPPSRPAMALCPVLRRILMCVHCPEQRHSVLRGNQNSSRLEHSKIGLPRKITSRRNQI